MKSKFSLPRRIRLLEQHTFSNLYRFTQADLLDEAFPPNWIVVKGVAGLFDVNAAILAKDASALRVAEAHLSKFGFLIEDSYLRTCGCAIDLHILAAKCHDPKNEGHQEKKI